MPHIIVTAEPNDQQEGTTVMLRERVNPADFESERFAANLVERLGWAVSDATEAEQDRDQGPTDGNGRPAVDAPTNNQAVPRRSASVVSTAS